MQRAQGRSERDARLGGGNLVEAGLLGGELLALEAQVLGVLEPLLDRVHVLRARMRGVRGCTRARREDEREDGDAPA